LIRSFLQATNRPPQRKCRISPRIWWCFIGDHDDG